MLVGRRMGIVGVLGVVEDEMAFPQHAHACVVLDPPRTIMDEKVLAHVEVGHEREPLVPALCLFFLFLFYSFYLPYGQHLSSCS